jgi:hypothetical protein
MDPQHCFALNASTERAILFCPTTSANILFFFCGACYVCQQQDNNSNYSLSIFGFKNVGVPDPHGSTLVELSWLW